MIVPLALTGGILTALLLSRTTPVPAPNGGGASNGGGGGGTTTNVTVGQTVRVPATDVLAVLPSPTQQTLNAMAGQGNQLENLYVRVREIEPGTGRIRGDVISYDFAGPARAGTREVTPNVPTPFFYSPNARVL